LEGSGSGLIEVPSRHLPGETMESHEKSIIFWDVTPCSLLSCNRCLGRTYRLHLQGRRNNFSKNQQVSRWQILLATCLLAEIISSTLKMEAICSSETSAATQQTTRRHIPEYDTLHNHRCENPISCIGYTMTRPSTSRRLYHSSGD
jgi:hypothetical protein